MAFKVIRNNNQQSESDTPHQEVDWEAYHNYCIEKADLKEPTVLPGYVAGIVDLGLQKQDDAKVKWEGTPEQEAAEIEKHPNTYFEDGVDQKGKPTRWKRWPQKDCQSVAVAVEFSDIMLNKGQFFGDDSGEEKPLRLWLGNEFYNSFVKKMVVGRPIPLKHVNIAESGKAVWSLAKNHTLYKLAAAAKLIAPDGSFTADRIDELLHRTFQWEARVFMKESKGKQYYTEQIKLTGGLARGQSEVTEFPTKAFIVQFDEPNDENVLKELRASVVNTMHLASNWEESIIKKELEAVRPSQDNSPAKEESPKKEESSKKTPPKPVQQKPKKVEAPAEDDFDPDIPF